MTKAQPLTSDQLDRLWTAVGQTRKSSTTVKLPRADVVALLLHYPRTPAASVPEGWASVEA